MESIKNGFYGIFNQYFFDDFGKLEKYTVFQPNGEYVFELSEAQIEQVKHIYDKMFEEIASDYAHKYDVLRNLTFELLHFAMKMKPVSSFESEEINASGRIAALFTELLERQFPIDEGHRKVQLRTPAQFAEQLNVHVNHLNRAVKEITHKTTTPLIIERILQESKVMLRHTAWDI